VCPIVWGLVAFCSMISARSAIRNMERAGISREVVKKISGHKTDSAYRRYNIVDNRDIENAGKKLTEFLKGQQ
jgi:hypothetical protein